jgi:hypothetical protein
VFFTVDFRHCEDPGRTCGHRSGGEPSAVMISAAEYERLKEFDRPVMRLDDKSGEEEMLHSEIPPECPVRHRGDFELTAYGAGENPRSGATAAARVSEFGANLHRRPKRRTRALTFEQLL